MSVLSLLIKPVGADCNLRCTYCFYRSKAALYPDVNHPRMPDDVLDRLIRDAMGNRAPSTVFAWQGGEPTLAGVEFYQRAIELQMRYGVSGQHVSNSLQTNGALLTPQWARFLREYSLLVGISVDGPADLHDKYRRDRGGSVTHQQVMDSMRLLRAYEVDFNVLVLLNNHNVKHPRKLYSFLVENACFFLQFVPCIETGAGGRPTPYSITPEAYGDFLCLLFDLWAADWPKVSIRDFDHLILSELDRPAGTCVHGDTCDDYLVVEHNGDVYPCDFFVQPELKLGSIGENSLSELAQLKTRIDFARQKSRYGAECSRCTWLARCRGGCLKHRLSGGGRATDPSYFCRSYRQLYEHSSETVKTLAARVEPRAV